MIKRNLKRALQGFGYEIHKTELRSEEQAQPRIAEPRAVEPVWPLPRRPGGFSDEEILKKAAKHDFWHYTYKFDGDVSFAARHNDPNKLADIPDRPLQRFRHFMPYLLQAQNGSLEGKRVLDIACNSGFWSIQCALLGADVVGFDARAELIEQANLIKGIVGTDNVEFRVLDFWDMSPQSLGGTFDIVLNLGILYHLPKPLEALELTRAMADDCILLDTAIYPSGNAVIKLSWEEPDDIRKASNAGFVAFPSKGAIDLMLKHMRVAEWFEIPLRTTDMPRDYLDDKRASWLIKV